MKKKNVISGLLAAGLLACVSWHEARAQDIVIAKGSGKTAVDWSGVQTGPDPASRDFLVVLQTGLIRSGWLERGRPETSDYVLTGQVQPDGAGVRVQLQLAQKSSRRILLNKPYRSDAAGVRGIAHAAADDIVQAITGRRGFASAKLIMVGNRTGHKELYMSDSDGRGLYPLTADKSVSIAPRWGHDNRSIFYTSYLRRFPAIYRIDLTTRGRTRVSNFSGLNTGGAISPDGREMALILSKDGNPDLYVMRLADESVTRLTATPQATEASPAWSPDGRSLVYVSDQAGTPHLYIISRTGGTPRQLTTRGRHNVSPDWGPHGEIVYASMIGGKFQVCVINPQTGVIRQVTMDNADHEDPTWAPNGRHIACAKSVQHKSRVYLIDTMGDPPILLTDYAGDWFSPKWSR